MLFPTTTIFSKSSYFYYLKGPTTLEINCHICVCVMTCTHFLSRAFATHRTPFLGGPSSKLLIGRELARIRLTRRCHPASQHVEEARGVMCSIITHSTSQASAVTAGKVIKVFPSMLGRDRGSTCLRWLATVVVLWWVSSLRCCIGHIHLIHWDFPMAANIGHNPSDVGQAEVMSGHLHGPASMATRKHLATCPF